MKNITATTSHAPLRPLTLSALMICTAQAPLNATMIAVALPAVSEAVGASLVRVTSLLVTSYLIVNIVAQSPGGKLSDRLGATRAAYMGMLLQAFSSVLALASSTLASLTTARILMALGGALIAPATLSLVRTHVPSERRGRALGLFGATMSLSAGLGPPLGGELVARFGPVAVFCTSLPIVAVCALLLRVAPVPPRQLATDAPRPQTRFDTTGTALLALALGALTIASRGEPRFIALGLLVFVATTVAFVLYELRHEDPVLDPRLFRMRAFATGSSLVMLHSFALFGVLLALPTYFEHAHGATPRETGRMLVFMMGPMFLMAVAGGRLTDRFGSRRAAVLGALPLLAGGYLLLALPIFTHTSDAAPALALLGVGFGLSGAPAQTAALSAVSGARAGMSAGATTALRSLGSVLAVIVLAALGSQLAGNASADELCRAYAFAVRLFSLSLVAAACVAFGLPAAASTSASGPGGVAPARARAPNA